MTETQAVKLSQTAPWNRNLRNWYRQRYAEVGGHYFLVESTRMREKIWTVWEIDADGEKVECVAIAIGLTDARHKIAELAA